MWMWVCMKSKSENECHERRENLSFNNILFQTFFCFIIHSQVQDKFGQKFVFFFFFNVSFYISKDIWKNKNLVCFITRQSKHSVYSHQELFDGSRILKLKVSLDGIIFARRSISNLSMNINVPKPCQELKEGKGAQQITSVS